MPAWDGEILIQMESIHDKFYHVLISCNMSQSIILCHWYNVTTKYKIDPKGENEDKYLLYERGILIYIYISYE